MGISSNTIHTYTTLLSTVISLVIPAMAQKGFNHNFGDEVSTCSIRTGEV